MSKPKFLIDGMLGKLARWLRLLGHEVKYVNQNGDNELIEEALNRKYVLLTSDVALYRKALTRGVESVLVTARDEPGRIAQLANRFQIPLQVNPDESKCPRCGFALKRIGKQYVEGKVPEKSFSRHEEYWICLNPGCSKIYWRGSHWRNIEKTLEKARLTLEKAEGE
ncbi:MAG: Mut7-C RNAse domain-containing protein, partial [Candidatus Bathyarchaeia archaeon]